jgi:glycosyltransferase involved in cell wall biosynthesis
MKILYDYQIFNIQRYGGISRYFIELMKNIHGTGIAEFTLPLVACNNGYVLDSEFLRCINTSKLDFFKASTVRKKSVQLNQWFTKLYAIKKNYDIYHPTYYDPYLLDCIGNKPLVVTVHDMIHEIFNEQYSKSNVIEQKKYLVSKASIIIAISENTKRDLINILGVDENKIKVIYHGSSFADTSILPTIEIDIPGNYILFVGDRWYYKNFDFFVRSVVPLLQEDRLLRVVCAGSIPFNNQEQALLAGLGVADRFLHYPAASDGLMIHLYKNARVFVFPSRYEGFGIPILEAFACGCPVIASNSSSLPEVGGDACVYINPQDSTSLTDLTRKVIYDDELRHRLRTNGYERQKNFSWDETTKQTVAAYSTVCC